MPLAIFYKKGIYVQFSSDNTLESNTAESSDEDGIMLYYSNDNTQIPKTYLLNNLWIKIPNYKSQMSNNSF